MNIQEKFFTVFKFKAQLLLPNKFAARKQESVGKMSRTLCNQSFLFGKIFSSLPRKVSPRCVVVVVVVSQQWDFPICFI